MFICLDSDTDEINKKIYVNINKILIIKPVTEILTRIILKEYEEYLYVKHSAEDVLDMISTLKEINNV